MPALSDCFDFLPQRLTKYDQPQTYQPYNQAGSHPYGKFKKLKEVICLSMGVRLNIDLVWII